MGDGEVVKSVIDDGGVGGGGGVSNTAAAVAVGMPSRKSKNDRPRNFCALRLSANVRRTCTTIIII